MISILRFFFYEYLFLIFLRRGGKNGYMETFKIMIILPFKCQSERISQRHMRWKYLPCNPVQLKHSISPSAWMTSSISSIISIGLQAAWYGGLSIHTLKQKCFNETKSVGISLKLLSIDSKAPTPCLSAFNCTCKSFHAFKSYLNVINL